ncbi:unnamed protein product [Closterium sp. NIES-64]|nr:unnamed protein product [Closterium sp. NIES-64]
MAAPRRAVTQGRGGAFSTAAGLLPVLVLALLLQAPSASARHWFWNDGLFPVAAKPATLTAAESDGPAEVAAGQPVSAVPAPAPAAPAPAPAPAVSCHDAPLNGFIAAGAAPDPCAALAAELNRTAGKLGDKTGGQGFAAPSLFRACHSTFLFRKDCDVEDLLSIANAFDNHYVYKHIAVDSPDQTNLPSSIDIVADLRKIVANAKAGKYPRLVDAHMAAFRATNALNDGHSAFHPTCFGGSSYDLPLPLMAVVENGQQIIRVAPRRYVTPNGLDHVAKVLHNFDFSLYEGRQVVAINGEKAEDFILNWADKEGGMFRNRAARFTKSFAANIVDGSSGETGIVQVPGDFARRAYAPENDTLLVSFAIEKSASTEDVQVAWIGTGNLTAFTNATEYWATFCAVEPSSNATDGTSAHASTLGLHGHGHAADTPVIYKFLKRHPDPVYYDDTSDGSGNLNVEIASLSAAAANGSSGAVRGPTVTRISPKDDLFLVYLMDNSTAVIWLHTFSDDIKDDVMDQEVTKALQTAAASNASQVIIDVRGNGGGSTVASYTAIRLLMGAAKVPDASFTMPMDFIIGSQYTENAIGLLAVNAASLYFIDAYSDLNGTNLTSVFGYAPFRERRFTAAGPAGNYSAPFKMTDRFTGKERQPVFGGRPFLVLSDGNCFSACAILTHVLGKRHKVPMVTVGGLPNQPPDVGSSCLGFTLMNFADMAASLRQLSAMAPDSASLPLNVKGTIAMALTNGYVDSEIPCEFEFLPSQHHINYTVDLIDKPWAMWNEVAKLFGSAAA